jgi:hypothetical protein
MPSAMIATLGHLNRLLARLKRTVPLEAIPSLQDEALHPVFAELAFLAVAVS